MSTSSQFLLRIATSCALAAALAAALPGAAGAQQQQQHAHGVLVVRVVTVTGTLGLASLPDTGGRALELKDFETQGRYRIAVQGLGAELVKHVGEAVTVVAFVLPAPEDGLPLLRIERFTLHATT